MLYKINRNISGLLLSALMLCLMSCGRDNDLDLINAKNAGLTVSYVLNGSAISLNGQTYSMTKTYTPIAVKLNKETKSADTVFATVNPALVAEYNRIYNENNQMVPANAFQVAHNGVFPISANSSQSLDSLYVLLTDASTFKDKGVYLIPVELKAKSGSALQNAVIYFKMTIAKGEIAARFIGASYRSYVYPSYQYGSLRLNYDRIQRSAMPNEVRFGVWLNTPFVYNDVNVSAEYVGDAAAIAYANKLVLNGNPQPFPADTYTINMAAVNVPKGAYVASDSITVTFRNKEKLLPQINYVMGVKIKRIVGSQYSVSPTVTDSSMAFIRIYTNTN